jgi:hypothetical protein
MVAMGQEQKSAGYSITSSARTSKEDVTLSRRYLAVLRLMMSSKLVGCWTGNSDGLSPIRTRAV